jgi:RNA polymerase sigma factor (sigma-70 family)
MSNATLAHSRSCSEQSVADLLLGISEGDMSAWEEIVGRYGRIVTAAIRAFRLSESDALDAVQTTWMRLAENHHRIRSPQYLGGWLATTARRECLRILRHAKRTTNISTTMIDPVEPSAGPEQQTVNALTAETLRDLVAELTPRQQTLIQALFVDEHPYTEISRITGIPAGSIGPTRIRALSLLRRRLHESGLI